MIDALEFMKVVRRICSTHECYDCPLDNNSLCAFGMYENQSDEYFKGLVDAVIAWKENHPVQTNADKFREVFGVDPIASDEHARYMCPPAKVQGCCESGTCDVCESWWDKPYDGVENG